MDKNTDKCKDCYYYEEIDKVGTCHRFPPVSGFAKIAGKLFMNDNITEKDHWCGEWKDGK